MSVEREEAEDRAAIRSILHGKSDPILNLVRSQFCPIWGLGFFKDGGRAVIHCLSTADEPLDRLTIERRVLPLRQPGSHEPVVRHGAVGLGKLLRQMTRYQFIEAHHTQGESRRTSEYYSLTDVGCIFADLMKQVPTLVTWVSEVENRA